MSMIDIADSPPIRYDETVPIARVAFGIGAAVGAFAAKGSPAFALGIPVADRPAGLRAAARGLI
ncbi:hypothetical protein JQ604_01535 [Bradyrhizobium jicamae]|uniref:hypothetical protein n=1 Tax=Bradyrhizobium jicamae TaxID=280332 RepID=UPI001BA551E9|nr:hypothetical protein [Bradyrhizobium jicamae]MBR0750846.1 hypothetical protein [Bradyrhizobium jicamae]